MTRRIQHQHSFGDVDHSEAVDMKVTTKRNIGFYTRSAKSFLTGFEDKDGRKKEAVHTLNISGLGDAINTAVAAAAAIEKEGIGDIKKIETSYPDMEGSQRGCARINIQVYSKTTAALKIVKPMGNQVPSTEKVSIQGAGVDTLLVIEDEAGDVCARERKEKWLSPPQWIPEGPIDLETIDCAAYINQFADKTKILISEANVGLVNKTWRLMLHDLFKTTSQGTEELNQWLSTGLSNGYPLRLQLMCLPPNTWFRVHAHPCIELMFEVAGAIYEARLMNKNVPRQFEKNMEGAPLGPNLVKLRRIQEEVGEPLFWKENTMKKGNFLANEVGSVHQSFTGEEGATLFLLWGGVHANCTPETCTDVSDLLRPTAGV